MSFCNKKVAKAEPPCHREAVDQMVTHYEVSHLKEVKNIFFLDCPPSLDEDDL